MFNIKYAQRSDKGKIRRKNEDTIDCVLSEGEDRIRKGSLFLIADGLGGLEHGEIASRDAVEEAKHLFQALDQFTDPKWLEAAITKANERICDMNGRRVFNQNMATTLTLSLFHGDKLYVGHVGDCRLYQIRDGQIRRVTADQSLDRYTLMQAIGTHAELDIQTHQETVKPADTYVQCSDGLHGEVSDTEILEAVTRHDPAAACDHLIQLVNSRQSFDNISIQIIRIH